MANIPIRDPAEILLAISKKAMASREYLTEARHLTASITNVQIKKELKEVVDKLQELVDSL